MTHTEEPKGQPRWRAFWWTAGALMLLFILVLAMAPVPDVLPAFEWSDKVVHFWVFCGLTVWFAALVPRSHYWKVLVALFLYGCLMELLQSQVPNRYADIADILANVTGTFAGWALARIGLASWAMYVENVFHRP